MKKLNLNKKVVSVLTDQEKRTVNGGGTTSYSNCTGFACCSYKDCADTSSGKRCLSLTGPSSSPELCVP